MLSSSSDLRAFLPVAVDLLARDQRDIFPSISDYVIQQRGPTESVGFFMDLTRALFNEVPPARLFQVSTFTAEAANAFKPDNYRVLEKSANLWGLSVAFVINPHPALVRETVLRWRDHLSPDTYLQKRAEDWARACFPQRGASPRSLTGAVSDILACV